MTTTDLWTYGESTIANTDLTGFKVEAIDGSIGKIDEASNEIGASYLVVDTGPWIFGKKVMLPAGVVDRVDLDEETVYVNRTKDEIKDASSSTSRALSRRAVSQRARRLLRRRPEKLGVGTNAAAASAAAAPLRFPRLGGRQARCAFEEEHVSIQTR